MPKSRVALNPGPRPTAASTPNPGQAAFERHGHLVRADLRLGQLVAGRPSGVTAHQWNTAARTRFDFVATASADVTAGFAIVLVDPLDHAPEAARVVRSTETVCAAANLPLLRVESAMLRSRAYGRRIIEYILDARAFAATVDATALLDPVDGSGSRDTVDGIASADTERPEEVPGYRDIVGRLPDGRMGCVNDLGVLARAAAVEAYANRLLSDPIIRGLHVTWSDGTAEGWGWAEVRDSRYLFERVRLRPQRLSCGIDPARLAEDLATAAIGERIALLGVGDGGTWHDRDELAGALAALKSRRDEMRDGFRFEHVAF